MLPASIVGSCIQHSDFLVTLYLQRIDHSHFFITSHKEIIPYLLNLEIIFTVNPGNLHFHTSSVKAIAVIITVIIAKTAIVPDNISSVTITIVIIPLTVLLSIPLVISLVIPLTVLLSISLVILLVIPGIT